MTHSKLQDTLHQIRLRSQLAAGRNLTHKDLAALAGVTTRCMGDWMRGVTSPLGMSAVLELLSRLPEEDAAEILKRWKAPPFNQPSKEL